MSSRIQHSERDESGDIEVPAPDIKDLEESVAVATAFRLYVESGYDLEAVRDQLGLHSKLQASLMVKEGAAALNARADNSKEVVIARHTEQLRVAHALIDGALREGNLGVIDLALKVQAREAKLHGTDAAPAESHGQRTVVIDMRLPHQRGEQVEGEVIEIDVTPELPGGTL